MKANNELLKAITLRRGLLERVTNSPSLADALIKQGWVRIDGKTVPSRHREAPASPAKQEEEPAAPPEPTEPSGTHD